MFFSLKNLLDTWSDKLDSEAEQVKAIEEIWKSIYPSQDSEVAHINIPKKELIIDVSNHSLMLNMQLSHIYTIDLINKSLISKHCDFKIEKIRFRLKT